MSILRSYIDKNNTITSNSYVNTARNPVVELNFGASDYVVPNYGYTRYIFDLDLVLLRQDIATGVISTVWPFFQRILKHSTNHSY